MEKKFHASDTDEGKVELKECFRRHLRPSRQVQNVLNDIKNSLPKSTVRTIATWVKVFFTSLLLPLALFFFDMIFDAVLVVNYHGDDTQDQYRFCRGNSTNRISVFSHQREETLQTESVYSPTSVTRCENKMEDMQFLCTPLALDNNSRFNYSMAFLISPWVFFFFEFFQSEEYEHLLEKVNFPLIFINYTDTLNVS